MSRSPYPLTRGDRVLAAIAGFVGPLLVRMLGATWSVTWEGRGAVAETRERGGIVFAFWHAHILPIGFAHRGAGVVVLSSWHRDGEISARVMRALGLIVERGSTTRGSVRGVVKMIARARAGFDLAVTPDGPKGPARVAKTGAVFLAARARGPIVPIAAAASSFRRLSSWDGFIVPRPFARVAILYGEPLHVSEQDDMEAAAERLTRELKRLEERAAARVRAPKPRRPAYAAYRFATRVVGALSWPFLAWLRSRRREWRERLGAVDPAEPRGGVWVHAASVGEIGAALPIVRELEARGERVVVTCVTPAGVAVARKSLPQSVPVAFAPLDLVPAVRRALAARDPRLIVLIETELWPNLLVEAEAHGVPVVMANARLSERSLARYLSAGSPLRGVSDVISGVVCQSEDDLGRFERLGFEAARLRSFGTTKFDALSPPLSEDARSELRQRLGISEQEAVVVFGSVRPREEAAVIRATLDLLERRGDLRVIVAPRHLARIAPIEEACRRAGLATLRRSELPEGPGGAGRAAAALPPGDAGERLPVVLLDTTGELSRVYAVARVAFVGGTLSDYGGHNPLEPAAHGVPVVIGRYVESCRESAELLVREGGALRVEDDRDLGAVIEGILADDALAAAMASAAARTVAQGRGATARAVDWLVERGLLSGSVPERGEVP